MKIIEEDGKLTLVDISEGQYKVFLSHYNDVNKDSKETISDEEKINWSVNRALENYIETVKREAALKKDKEETV